MRTDTMPLRESLVAALTAAGLPMSTDDLAASAPPKVEQWGQKCPHPHDHKLGHLRVVECVPGYHVIERTRRGCDVYPHLRALERDGRVERVRIDGARHVYWQLTRPAEQLAEIADLEALWAAS